MSATPVFGRTADPSSLPPITFLVAGEATEFVIHQPVPVIPLMDMAAQASDGDLAGALVGFMHFFQGCFVTDDGLPNPTEGARFRNAVTRARMGAEDLLPIVQYVVQAGTEGRPTMPSSASWPTPAPMAAGGGPAGSPSLSAPVAVASGS